MGLLYDITSGASLTTAVPLWDRPSTVDDRAACVNGPRVTYYADRDGPGLVWRQEHELSPEGSMHWRRGPAWEAQQRQLAEEQARREQREIDRAARVLLQERRYTLGGREVDVEIAPAGEGYAQVRVGDTVTTCTVAGIQPGADLGPEAMRMYAVIRAAARMVLSVEDHA